MFNFQKHIGDTATLFVLLFLCLSQLFQLDLFINYDRFRSSKIEKNTFLWLIFSFNNNQPSLTCICNRSCSRWPPCWVTALKPQFLFERFLKITACFFFTTDWNSNGGNQRSRIFNHNMERHMSSPFTVYDK